MLPRVPRPAARVAGPARPLATVLFVLAIGAPAVEAQRLTRGPFASDWLAQLEARPALPERGVAPRWFPWDNQFASQGTSFRENAITVEQRAAWDAQLQDIARALTERPLLRRPIGLDYSVNGSISVVNSTGWLGRGPEAPLAGSVSIGPWLQEVTMLDADGRLRFRSRGEHTSFFYLELNRIPAVGGAGWMRDEVGAFAPLPLTGEWQGLPIVGNALVLTRNGRSPYAPVSQGRVLDAYLAAHRDALASVETSLAHARQELAEFTSAEGLRRRRAAIEAEVAKAQAVYGADPEQRWRIAQRREQLEREDAYTERKLRAEADPPLDSEVFSGVRALLAARTLRDRMSPAERAAPAWLPIDGSRWQDTPQFAAAGTPGFAPVVEAAADFFDRRLPRHAIQIIIVPRLEVISADIERSRYNAFNLALFQDVDWAALRDRFVR